MARPPATEAAESKLRTSDLLHESWLEIRRHPGRTMLTALGVALGSAAIVATLTLVDTIRFQISDDFDTRLATQVELRATATDSTKESESFPPSDETIALIESLSGVEGVAVVREAFEPEVVQLNQILDPSMTPGTVTLFGVNSSAFEVLDASIEGPGWVRWHSESKARVAVVGSGVFSQAGVAELSVGDHIFVGGLRFTVVGALIDSPRLPILAGGLVVPIETLSDLFDVDTGRDRVIVTTKPGAASAVSEALPTAFAPTSPASWTAYSPLDDRSVRQSVDARLQALAVGLGLVVIVLGLVTISNTTTTSVLQRIHEIGLRRALGARPSHIAAHVLADATIVGGVGGVAGAILGLTATLMVTAIQGWLPVIDPAVPIASALGGMTTGGLAGLYPARVGSRLQPTEALRRE